MDIQRSHYLNQLIAARHNGMIKVITGMRRCGKSYLLFNLFRNYLLEQGVQPDHIIAINLEDMENKPLRNADALYHYLKEQIRDEQRHYILLDEIQFVPAFEDVLNSFLDKDYADVYVTGSNARFLANDIITEFRGRGWNIQVYPLSFKEFMSVYEGHPYDGLKEYLRFGGLPKVATMTTEAEKRLYLETLMRTTYLRDIKDRYNIQKDDDLLELMNVIASGIGGLTNPQKIANTFQTVKKSGGEVCTIAAYLGYMQDAFLIEKSIRYDIKGRHYISTPSKYYFTDLGLRNAQLNFRQIEESHLLENLIYNELRMRGMSVDVGQVIVNTKENGVSKRLTYEVDFVCNKAEKRFYVQSALTMPNEAKVEQELYSLRRIQDSFAKYVIVGDNIINYINNDGIHILNVYDFLLKDSEIG